MEIRRIKWKNDPILGNLMLDLVDHSTDRAYSTVVFVGENGTGKSTILNQLCDCLSLVSIKPFDYIEYMADGQLLKAEPILNDLDNSFYKRTNINTGQSEEIRHSRVYGGISECEKDSLDIRHYGCIMSKARADFRAEKITGTKASSLDGNRYQNDSKDDFTELKQLIVDIHEMDNEEFGNRGRRSGSIPISWDSYYPDSRIYRFKEAINGFFSDLSFDGVYTKNGEKCIVFTKNGNEIPIDSLSTGEKQIVFRGVYLLQNLEQFDGATVFIDEPELSMHPKWQEKILQYYQNLFKRGDGTSRVQLFVASHSEMLLEAALEDKANTLVIVLKSNQGSIEASEVRQPFILPTITSSEINYLAFDVCSIDYHIALYGEIQSRYSLTSIISCDRYIKNSPQYNTLIHEKPSHFRSNHYDTLTSLIRNHIDHPDNPYSFTKEELRLSIELMRDILLNNP